MVLAPRHKIIFGKTMRNDQLLGVSSTTLNSSTNLSLTSLYDLVKFIRASLIAQLVKNPPAIQETPVRFLGWEDPLEKG